ncbi:MAG: hypothetical protein CMM77_10565 [Rhodospirillaceae bacterium]|nr:hypothetical protein [Magnetovibrio sp.]MAY67559.1 hypothetical protein [Rhodospirillaceae bacterium]
MSIDYGDWTVRVDSVGGDVAPYLIDESSNSVSGQVLVLVHGFKNSRRDAWDRYEEFLDQVLKYAGGIPGELSIRGFTWPGDANFGPVSFAGFLSYPVEVRDARMSARRLAYHLATLTGPEGRPVEISLLGHSLGCRLILEALANLVGQDKDRQRDGDEDGPRVPVNTIFIRIVGLMAAAVPVVLVEEGGRLEEPSRIAGKRLVFHSSMDQVLRFAFPAGQILSHQIRLEDQPYLNAVGLYGEPVGFGEGRESLYPNSHGDYWGDYRIASRIANEFGAAVIRELKHRETETYQIPEMPELVGRNIGGRDISGDEFR